MAQHAILRFEKHKGNPARPLEAHHERQKEQYASNPDIDTSRSKYNFHIVKPESRYYHFIQSRIEQAGCRTRKDSTRFVDTLITASPEFFKKKSPKEIQAFFQRAADFLIGRVGKENIVSAAVSYTHLFGNVRSDIIDKIRVMHITNNLTDFTFLAWVIVQHQIKRNRAKYLSTCIGSVIAGFGGLYYVMDYANGVWSNDGFGETQLPSMLQVTW